MSSTEILNEEIASSDGVHRVASPISSNSRIASPSNQLEQETSISNDLMSKSMPEKGTSISNDLANKSMSELSIAEKTDAQANQPKEPYPKIVFLIILNEFCERFSFYGMRTILYIYLTSFIGLSKDTGTAIYHAYNSLCYFTPILGAIVADGFIGLYLTIVILSFVYLGGEIIVTLTSITPLGAPNLWGPIIGLVLIALGTGGIKPCVSAFGGNQFKPTQTRYLENFFSIFYLSINIGSTIATILTPIFRSDVRCFNNECYPLAFGVPALFMAIAITLFIFGTPYYVRNKVNKGKNVIAQTGQVIFYGIKNKINNGSGVKKEHWLDHAESSNFDKQLISDVKAFLRVLLVFLPLPIFWTLYEQQGSRWTEQAQQLSGRIGRSFTIKPDQFQAINPILIVVLVPIFDAFVYPFLGKFNILKKQLQRILVGLLIACVSFGIAAILEKQMQVAHLSKNPINQIRIFNAAPCDLEFTYGDNNEILKVAKPDFLKNKDYSFPNEFADLVRSKNSTTNVKYTYNCAGKTGQNVLSIKNADNTQIYIFYYQNGVLRNLEYNYDIHSEVIGTSQIKFLTLPGVSNTNLIPLLSGTEFTATSNLTSGYKKYSYANYKFEVKDKDTSVLKSDDFLMEICGQYTVFLFMNEENKLDFVQVTEVYQNGISIWWQLIQIFVMTIAEIMFSISGVSFAYSQAPASMKSVLQATWFLTVAFGNLIVVIIAEARFIQDQVYEYVFFAGLLFLATAVFFALSYNYKYVEDQENKQVEENKKNAVVPFENEKE
ncbi:unnamed protein product [Brachionus calyciflorus]|uniref:Uncharacterized protein n=1 Tax=Brachionus calyciflorus TaxID=104777 RepID=A0A813UCZ5_9BILA|nr:unnamed protein product [Brachionus calyciflorus]